MFAGNVDFSSLSSKYDLSVETKPGLCGYKSNCHCLKRSNAVTKTEFGQDYSDYSDGAFVKKLDPKQAERLWNKLIMRKKKAKAKKQKKASWSGAAH